MPDHDEDPTRWSHSTGEAKEAKERIGAEAPVKDAQIAVQGKAKDFQLLVVFA